MLYSTSTWETLAALITSPPKTAVFLWRSCTWYPSWKTATIWHFPTHRCATKLADGMVPTLPWYHALVFLPAGVRKGLCLQHISAWHFIHSWRAFEAIRRAENGILTRTRGEMAYRLYVIRTTKDSMLRWTKAPIHLQITAYFSSGYYVIHFSKINRIWNVPNIA